MPAVFAMLRNVTRAEVVLLRVIGVLLILLGATLCLSPQVRYSRTETVIQTRTTKVKAKREKTLLVPRAVSVLIIGTGVLVASLARRRGAIHAS